MVSVKDTPMYNELIKEFNYHFGDVFLFDGYAVAEAKEGIIFNWEEHGRVIAEDVFNFLGVTDGANLAYISNRINSFSVVPGDWLKFYKYSSSLKSYSIVSQSKGTLIGSMIENLFFKGKIKRFNSIYTAIDWIKKDMSQVVK